LRELFAPPGLTAATLLSSGVAVEDHYRSQSTGKEADMTINSHAASAKDLIALHEQLHQQIQDLTVWLKEAGEFGRPQFGQLGDRVRAIRDVVARHFAVEEDGGYMAAPLAAAPHLADRAGKLLADHARLLAEFDRLSESLCQCPTTYTCWGDACRDLEQVIEHLTGHEHLENELWYEAFETDEATVD
jgi:hypothetical protein